LSVKEVNLSRLLLGLRMICPVSSSRGSHHHTLDRAPVQSKAMHVPVAFLRKTECW
jgi:hypothetical protein